ncbi:acid phosphatase [Sphingomonas koreensis]|nr:acid phosphatase [Sphingomonas koreensis]
MRHVSRRGAMQFLSGAGLAAIAPLDRLWARGAAGDTLNFLAVGDWGREGRNHQRDVAVQMGRAADRLGAQFVVSVGDNFYDDGVASIDDPAWRNSFEQVYDAPSLQVPWQVALGNHDYRGSVQAQIDYSAVSKRWRLPARWYDFTQTAPDGATVHFFVIDTSPMIRHYYDDGATVVKVGDQRANVPVQLAWLDRALARSSADWKIVIGHHPVYTGKASEQQVAVGNVSDEHRQGGNPELIAALDPILQRHDVALYLNGHDHDLQHVHHGDTHYICTGAGSLTEDRCFAEESDFCSFESGFVACRVDRQNLSVAYIDYRGRQLDVVDLQPWNRSTT